MKHVPLAKARLLFVELQNVDGNKSFTDSVKIISRLLGPPFYDDADVVYEDKDFVVRASPVKSIRDGKVLDVYVHDRAENGAELQPGGYLLGINMLRKKVRA